MYKIKKFRKFAAVFVLVIYKLCDYMIHALINIVPKNIVFITY